MTVIVTSASRGLGEATATIAASLGAALVLTARSAADLCGGAAAIEAAGGQAYAIPADIRQPEDCERLVHQTIEKFWTAGCHRQ